MERVPHSMIVHTGKVGLNVKRLEKDIRQVMLPFTAKDLLVGFFVQAKLIHLISGQEAQ
jgi:hypothetical protein